jgi:MFS family permease
MYQYGFKNILFASGTLVLLLALYAVSQEQKQKTFNTVNQAEIIRLENQNNIAITKRDEHIKWLILACLFLVGAIVSQMSSTYPVYIQTTFSQFGIKSVSILFTINCLLVVFFATPIGNIFGNYNKIRMVGIGSFLIGLGMFLLSLSNFFILAILSCVIYTFGEIIFFSIAQLIYYQKSHKKRKGHNIGIYRVTYASSRVIGPLIGGTIYHQFGSNMIWYLSGIIGIACLTTCSYFKKYS